MALLGFLWVGSFLGSAGVVMAAGSSDGFAWFRMDLQHLRLGVSGHGSSTG